MRRTAFSASGRASTDTTFLASAANPPRRRPGGIALSRLLQQAPRTIAALSIAAGAVVLAGWLLEVPILVTGLPGLVPMRANAAVGFILCGTALWLLSKRGVPRRSRLALLPAALAFAAGLLTSFEHLAGVRLGIDELVASDRLGLTGASRGRMPVTSAAEFVALGAALALTRWPGRAAATAVQSLCALAAVIAVPGLLGYTFNLEEFRDTGLSAKPMALHASVLFLLLAAATAALRPDARFRHLLASDGPGGATVRRLLPIGTLVSITIGWALLRARWNGVLGQTETVALVATANLAVFGALVIWNAISLDRAEETRSRLAAIVASSSDSIISKDLDGTIRSWNAGATALYGYDEEEALGRPVTMLTGGEATAEVRMLLARVARGELIAHHETLRRRKDGTLVEVSVALSPIRDATGAIVGASTIARDISERTRLERAARDAEARFRVLVDQALVGIYIVEDGRFTYVNRRMAELFGYTPEEMTALPTVMDIVDPSHRDRVAEQMRHRAGGGTSHYEARGRRKDGSALLTEIHGSALPGDTPRLVGMVLDITEQRANQLALRDREERLREAQAVAHVGSWELEVATGVLQWSDETFRIFGLEPRSAPPSYQSFLERIHPDDRNAVDAAYSSAVAAGLPYAVDHRIVLADGTIRHVHERCVTHYDRQQRPVRSVGTVQDVTERKQAQEALKRLNDELESRVEQRTAELQAANRELEAFSYSVSHDLRAPLRALQGFSRILLEEHAPSLPAEASRYVTIIRDSAAQMGTLVDDLLTFSRLGRQPLRAHPIDMAALVGAALDQLAEAREGRDVRIDIGPLPGCYGDPSLLRQVVINLLSNAWKFTRCRERAEIAVGALPDPQDSRMQAYFVRDNGAGFDMQYAGKLFGIFQRLHSAAEYEGTGVGLAIVQRIVHRHGGRVWAEGLVDGGATFYFSLPEGAGNGTESG